MFKRLNVLLAFVLVLQLTLPFAASAADDKEPPVWGPKIDYLALGDSLAAGMNENGGMGKGYSDFLATSLNDVGMLDFYTNDFAVPGYKTTNVLADIVDNKKIVVDGKELAIQTAIKDAELITLTMGANNLFQYIKQDANGKYRIDTQGIFSEIKKIGADYKTFFTEVKKLNPNVQVFVQGYYNSFPYEGKEYQEQLNFLVNTVNAKIKEAIEAEGGVIVPTADLIAQNVTTYLPNPKNVHLSEVGYKAVATAFLEKINSQFKWTFNAVPSYDKTNNPTAVVLSWASASDNVAVNGYHIYANDKLVATVDAKTLNYKYAYVIPGDTYHFKISAFDAAGNESYVNPRLVLKTDAKNLFKDTASHWAKNEINYVAELGIMKGYKDQTFKPNGNVTRLQAAAIITRALGLKATHKAPFKDIRKLSNTLQTEVAAAYEAGIIKGSKGMFQPNEPVTRQQLALMLNRAYKIANNGTAYTADKLAPFKDIAGLDKETKTAITMLYESKMIPNLNNAFKPNQVATRGETAKMFATFVQVVN